MLWRNLSDGWNTSAWGHYASYSVPTDSPTPPGNSARASASVSRPAREPYDCLYCTSYFTIPPWHYVPWAAPPGPRWWYSAHGRKIAWSAVWRRYKQEMAHLPDRSLIPVSTQWWDFTFHIPSMGLLHICKCIVLPYKHWWSDRYRYIQACSSSPVFTAL